MITADDRDILHTVIEVYVGEGVPVSSQRVREAGRFRMSTATIRNRMAALEREGFITKPHISSGRIPTDDGYRAYVDELQSGSAWAERGDCIAPPYREGLRAESRDVNAIMMQASQLLGTLSKNLAVVYGTIVQESRVKGIKLFRLDGRRLMVVVTLVPEHEHAVTHPFDREFAPEVVANAESLVNRLVAGRTPDEAKQVLAETVRDNVTDEGIILREISICRDEILSEPPAIELCFEERSHLLEQPELSHPRTMQLLLRILHDREYLVSILSNRPLDRTEVTIGTEHGDDTLRPFSVVTAGYRMGAAHGVLGIIGPTRMRYDLALSLVGSMSRELRAIGDEFFQ